MQRPKKLGGLGVLDLDKFGTALRHRWLWQAWTQEDKPWQGMQTPCTSRDRKLFMDCTEIQVHNGKTALVWQHQWIGAKPLKELAPTLYALVKRKNRTVCKELTDRSWIKSV